MRLNATTVVGGLIGLTVLVFTFKWLLITAAILVVPFGIWWAVDRSRRVPEPVAAGGLAASGVFAAPPRAVSPRLARPVVPAPTRVWPEDPATDRLHLVPALPSAPASASRGAAEPAVLPAEIAVTVTREEDHQPVLAEHVRLHGPHATTTLASGVVGRGKHRGSYAVEVRLGGRRVGELTKAMSDRYGDLVRAAEAGGDSARAVGVVTQGERGYQIDLRMPRRS